jgi:hypothetical protein
MTYYELMEKEKEIKEELYNLIVTESKLEDECNKENIEREMFILEEELIDLRYKIRMYWRFRL